MSVFRKFPLVVAVTLAGVAWGGESLRPPAPAAGGTGVSPSSAAARRPASTREQAAATSITSSGSLVLAAPAPRRTARPPAVEAAPTQSDLDFLSRHGAPIDSGQAASSETYGSLGMPQVPGSPIGAGWGGVPSASSVQSLSRMPPEVRGDLVTFGEARTPQPSVPQAPPPNVYAPRAYPPAQTNLPQRPPPPSQQQQQQQAYDVLPRRLAEMSRYDRIAMEPYPDYDKMPLHEKERLYTRQFIFMKNRRPVYSPETLAAIQRSESRGVPRAQLYGNQGGRGAPSSVPGADVKMENLRTKGLALPKGMLKE